MPKIGHGLSLTRRLLLLAQVTSCALLAACTTSSSDTSQAGGKEFRDCKNCPAMIALPPGSFLMGTPEADRFIDARTGQPVTNDSPQHLVTIAKPFAMGKFEVTVEEFGQFIAATGYVPTGPCMEFSPPETFAIRDDINWQNRGFMQSDSMPVGCVTLFDAQAYTIWLSKLTGQSYRLPSEAEWEYAARAGSTTPFYWGTDLAAACDYANVRSAGADTISKAQAISDREDGFACDDGFAQPSPAGSFAPNAFGLHDMQANAWEWVTDCNHKDYKGAPSDGSAWIDANDCQFGVIRSGSYLNRTEQTGSAVRAGRPRESRATNMGFRVVRAEVQDGVATAVTTPGWQPAAKPVDEADAGAQLFSNNCAACHVNRNEFQGIYGKDQTAIENTIRTGGNNVMSMPAFGKTLTSAEISAIASYIRKQNNWQD